MRKKIIITGSCGFIFSNFIRKAIYDKLPYTFVSIDRVNTNVINSMYWNKNHTFHVADIRDQHVIDVIFQFEKPDIVIHGAANSHVDNSLTDPNSFVTSNVLGTQVIINACVKHNVEKLLYVSCYDEKTKAVTKDGLKTYEELNIGDKVLTINPITKEIEEKTIKNVIVQDYSGDMLHFNSNRSNLLVTPNHRFICERNSNLEWITAEELEDKVDNDKYYLPIGEINKSVTNNIQTINISNIGDVDAEALFYVSGVFIGDGFNAYQKKIVKNKSGYSKEDVWKLGRDPKTGRFTKLSGGQLQTSTCNSYRIFFDVPENDKARENLESALTKLNIKYSCYKAKSGEHIYFSSKEWMEYFESFGKYAKNKQIPLWMFDYDAHLLYKLWLGIHDSDGHGLNIDNRNVSITTVSSKLVSQLCYLGSMIGFQTKIDYNYSESHLNGRKISGYSYVVYFSNNRKVLLHKPIRQSYTGKIWCLQVEDNKNFLIEREGKIAFCGNTDEVLGQLNSESDPSWTEESPINPRNPYAASKAAGELMVKAAHYAHGLTYNITRSANNYGPRQTPDKLIPKVIKSILQDSPIPIYGKGEQIRDWINVFDNCAGILTVLEKGSPNEIYNISAGHEISNIELVNKICNIMKKGHELIIFVDDPRKNAHDFRYSIDSSKLKNLGWKNNTKLSDGLEQTVSWYNQNLWWFK